MFKDSAVEEIKGIISNYPDTRSALLPVLHIAQRENGWLTPDSLLDVADILNLPSAFVRGVATFHVMYNKAPVGRHLIQLCTNVSCMLFGAERLVDILAHRYELKSGGTTPDDRFTLLIMECIGECDAAPAMLVGEDLHSSLNEKNIIEILEGYK